MNAETIARALMHCAKSNSDCETCPAFPTYKKLGSCFIAIDTASALHGLIHDVKRLKRERVGTREEFRIGGMKVFRCCKCRRETIIKDNFCPRCGVRLKEGVADG